MLVELTVEAERISVETFQEELDKVWLKALGDPASRMKIARVLSIEKIPEEVPFEASPGEEGFGVVELILIAAAGRLAATIPERLLVKLFDEVLWPRLQVRFGNGIKRKTNEIEPGDDASES